MLNYLFENWVSIIALLISLTSLVTGIITRREAKQIQLQEKYNELNYRNINLTIQVNTLIQKLIYAKGEHVRVSNLASQNQEKINETDPSYTQLINNFADVGVTIESLLINLAESQITLDFFKSYFQDQIIKTSVDLTKLTGMLNNAEAMLKPITEHCAKVCETVNKVAKIVDSTLD